MSKKMGNITDSNEVESVDKENSKALTSQDIESKNYTKEIKFDNFIDALIEIIAENNSEN